MENTLLLAYLWLVHVLLTSPVVVPVVWFARHRVRWHWWETAVFVAPFALWLTLVFADWRPKSLANLGECFFISSAIVGAAVLRALLGRVGNNKRVPVAFVVGVTGVAVATYFITPMWPE